MSRAPNTESYFLDLSPLEEGDPTFKADSFWPGILDACQDPEGNIYGVSIFVEPTGIYYFTLDDGLLATPVFERKNV